ncbi:hypothetical protein ALQ18_200047 [Pseudomonas marginalis pv. marginalis]|nr:hypothetical protein ALQ18_200047 [Pseudomonas marginalis pv. marginalis]
MLGRDLFKRGLRRVADGIAVFFLHLLHVLLERRGFFQRMTQIQADQAQRCCDKERNTPTPVEEVAFADDTGDQHHYACAEHEAGNRAEIKPTAHKAALSVGRVFSDEDRRARVFAAHREALRQFG